MSRFDTYRRMGARVGVHSTACPPLSATMALAKAPASDVTPRDGTDGIHVLSRAARLNFQVALASGPVELRKL